MMPDEFWPTSLLGWLTVAGMIATAMGGIWAFAQSVEKINGLGERVDRAMGGVTKRIDVQEASMGDFDIRLDEQHDRISRLENRTESDARLINEIVVKPMERLVSRLEALASAQDKQAVLVDGLTKAVERLERRMDGGRI
jgi:ferritin-like metal-binding protein YciE